MDFSGELEQVLPADLPQRIEVVAKAAHHLALIQEANQYLNLTRITSPREAAIKHVLDSVTPWRQFSKSRRVLDAGTGAGFPGIPLAIALPDIQFLLVESIQKKARFVSAVIEALGLKNVSVKPYRAEELLRTHKVDLITARAVAPISKMLTLFGAAVQAGSRLLLYKGPDAASEIAEATEDARRKGVHLALVDRYELPDQLGSRTLVEISRTAHPRI